MQFDLLRLNLIARPANLFTYSDAVPNRDNWLRQVFGREIRFKHKAVSFHYVPDIDAKDLAENVIFGRIGRRKKSKENEPPETGMRETEREAWHALKVIIDPTHHEDGQKTAVERSRDVARSLAVLTSLASQINRSPDPEPYLLAVEAITEESTFWTFVDQHPLVTSLTLEFLAPNMFGLQDDYDRDRKKLKDEENSDRTKLEMNSRDGLKIWTPLVKKAVSYISKGTGKIRAKSRDGHKFNSEDSVKSETFPELDKNMTWSEIAKTVVQRMFP